MNQRNYTQEITDMIEAEKLKENNIKLLVGMPMYGGMLSEATFHGMMQLQFWAGAS